MSLERAILKKLRESSLNSKTVEEKRRIPNLYSYLKSTKANEIIVRTSLVSGGWHDNESDANSAGFKITKFINPEYKARREFAECYRLVRK